MCEYIYTYVCTYTYRGLRALAEHMKEGALMHIFVYSALGRREIMLMQEALALLQGVYCNML